MQQQGGGGGRQMRQLRQGQQRRQPSGETVLTRWVGHYVVVKYLAGPADPANPEDPRSLAVSEPEARSGIFHPWGAVLSIRGTTEAERVQGGGRLTREQVAQLAMRDNI
jgi:hypothetical protein